MTRATYWSRSLVGAALFGATLVAGDTITFAQGEQTANYATTGGYFFRTYCAVCHGATARGDGPLADTLRRRPANLTVIARRNKGIYPKDLVFKIIDGRSKVPGHGGPDMPVWGDAFMRSAEGANEAAVRHRIQALVDYLETLQARDTQN